MSAHVVPEEQGLGVVLSVVKSLAEACRRVHEALERGWRLCSSFQEMLNQIFYILLFVPAWA